MAQPHDISQPADRPISPPDLDEPRLRRYLPPALADNLIRDLRDPRVSPTRMREAIVHLASARAAVGTYLPRQLSMELLQERLESPWLHWIEGSLLFADLSGSTALAEQLGARGREGTEMVTAFLNQIFTALIEVIQDYGGDLVTFGGDALLVFFGDDRHPRTATRAALALRDLMRDYVRVVPGIGTFPMHLHVGVESGPVAFVSAGGPRELHYGVLGATVNGVAAAEARARPNEVVAGSGAWATLAGFAAGEEIGAGFQRIVAMRAPARPHPPLPHELTIAEVPERAIAQLLDDLDRGSPYIPSALLRRILAEPQLPHLEADLRPVSMLFAQVVGLETLAAALPPEQAARAVHIYLSAMQAAIEQFGGGINKLDAADAGVKLVAFFGAPAAYEDHAERAARAALELQARLDEVNTQIASLVEDQRPTINGQMQPIREQPAALAEDSASALVFRPWSVVGLRQRIGLNMGTAFAGNVGSTTRKEYTVMGDAVNVAARVMSQAAWGEVWCSAATFRAIDSRITGEDRGELTLKGKALPVQLFRLLGPRDAPVTPIARGEGPLIGRASELAWLARQLEQAIGGAGGAVRIIGEAGVGKSRLAAELVERAAARGVRVIAAACLSYTTSIPYAAWGAWLSSLCGIMPGDDDALRERKVAARLAELGPQMVEWLPILGDLARLDVPDNRLTRGLDPQMRQTRRFELLEQLLLLAARDGPVLALFEDLHWADPVSLDLWRRVATAVVGHPILLLGVHRTANLFDGSADAARVLELKELSSAQSASLLQALAGDVALPEPLVRKLVERAAGNPLFLAEVLRAGMQRLAVRDGGLDEINLPARIAQLLEDLPDSLNRLLLARIDQLDDSCRNVLRIGSVIGKQIWFNVLHAIQSADQQSLLHDLARLDAENLTVLERAEPERVHAFRHTLMQEVAYQSLLYARRRELHGRIGAYLERRYAGDLDDYCGLLAHHFRLSDRRDKAVVYLLKAGHAAQAVYANDEAIQYYTWAIEALLGDYGPPPDLPARPAVEAIANARLWEARDALGDVLATVGRYDEALAQHTAILHAPGVPAETARRAHHQRGNVLEKQSQYVAALEELDRAMTIARSGGAGITPLAVALIDADIALVHKRRGEYAQAIVACEEGLRAILHTPGAADGTQIEARLHSELGGIYGWRGDYPRAHEHFAHSLQLRTAMDDLPGMIVSHNNLGYLWQLQSEYERAIEHYHIAEELAKKINLRYAVVFAAGNAAFALINLGAYGAAEARCVEALTIAREINAQHNIAQGQDLLGLIAYYRGDYDRAREAYDGALHLNRALGGAYQEADNLIHIALTLNAQGRFAEAEDEARRALERATSLGGQGLKVESLNALAEAALGRGDLAAATLHAEEAAALGETIGSRREVGIARRTLGEVAARRGAPFAPAFDASIALLTAIKDRFELGRTWGSYGIWLIDRGNRAAGRAYLNQARAAFRSIGANGELQRLSLIVERST